MTGPTAMDGQMLAGWGQFPRARCRVITASGADLSRRVGAEAQLIARGNGRAYGDAALNRQATLLTGRHDRLLGFDAGSGILTCESGVLLSDILDRFIPLGWFVPVTPGTKLVTIGGMVAADVHGKNHHMAGSFSRHVLWLELIGADGSRTRCSAQENPDLFFATCGGMGLTGVIATVCFRLMPIASAWIRQKTIRCDGLDTVMAGLEAALDWTYAVAWIDGLAQGARLGRSLLYLGEHADPAELDPARRARPLDRRAGRPLSVPFTLPDLTLNSLSVRAFNELYYRRGTPGTAIVDLDSYFYPLDGIAHWNRIYGRSGFTQYQCVLPRGSSRQGLERLLAAMSAAGIGSFLAVLKLLGPEDGGWLSFPMEGYTLAMDFPLRPPSLSLLLTLDAIVADHGGRLYLAKDARMGAGLLRRGYPGLDLFRDLRHRTGAAGRFTSLLSERLDL